MRNQVKQILKLSIFSLYMMSYYANEFSLLTGKNCHISNPDYMGESGHFLLQKPDKVFNLK